MPEALQESKFFQGDNLSVRQLGCKVDGVTDDTINFNKALIAAANVGTALMIPGDAPLMCSRVSIPSNVILIGRPGARIQQIGSTLGTLTFSGSGLNDATSGGIFTDTSVDTFIIIIDGTGTPDSFKWRKNGGAFTSGVSITGSSQTLSDGVTIRFAAITGHHLGDQWTLVATPGSAMANTPLITNSTHGGPGNSNILLQGITINGAAASQQVAGVDLIYLQNVTGVSVRGCVFENALRAGLYASLINGIDIEQCTFTNCGAGNTTIGSVTSKNVGSIYLAARSGNNFLGTGGAISGVRIRGCTIDGRSAHTSCIKLDADSSNFIRDVIISDNLCYVGDATVTGVSDTSTLGIELFSGTPGTNCILDFSVHDNVVIAENSPSPNAFGISIGGAGSINGTVSGNTLRDCAAFGIETIGSSISVVGNASAGCGEWTIDSGSGSVGQIVLADNVIVNPSLLFGIHNAIHVIAHSTSGPGPYTISDVIIKGNTIISSATSANSLLVVESQVSGYNIARVQITGNHLIGGGTSSGSGISIGPNIGLCDFVSIQDNFFESLSIGINPGGTNTRYLFNRFRNVTSQYGGAIASDAIVVDIDSGTANLNVQSILVRGNVIPTLAPNGDIVIPVENQAILSGSSAQENPANPNIVAWNGVNFGTTSQGGIFSVNSRWAGSSNWVKTSTNAYNGAMFVVLGASRFGIMFGNAANSLGASPGTSAFYVDDNGGSPEVVINASLFPGIGGSLALQTDGTGKVIGVTPPTSGMSQLTGDVTAGPGSGSQVATLAATGVTPGTYGDATDVPVLTIDGKGRVTAASTTPVSGGSSPTWSGYSLSTSNLSSVTTNVARGSQSGKVGHLRIQVQGTSNGSNPTFSLPYSPGDIFQTFAVTVFNGTTADWVPASCHIVSSSITVFADSGAGWSSGTSYTIWIQGVYETT